ncbi:hypothetical protein BGX31_004218 [Mortierella sp. GBA43]|nr:hypothetical protein BGX31_004218 [Mortierella sp. GBA43]
MTHEATNAGDQILNSHRHDSQLVEQREQQQHNGSPIHDIAGTENARTEAASKLLASILVFYKNTILSPIAQSYLPPLLKDLDAYVAALPSPGTHHLSKGATELEKLSASIALSPISTEGAIPLADYLFYAIVNLRRPLHSFQASIELMEDSCEDIEFTSLVRRIAKKIGIHKPTSNMEQLQSKLYHYLELVVMDPIQYSRRKNISAYMTKTEWKTTLDHDVVFHFYLIENRSQMLLFLEAIKAVGIEVSVYEPGQIQKAILGEQSLMDIALVQLYQVQKQLRLTVGRYRSVSSGEPEKTSDGFTATCILDMAFDLTVENLDPTSSIQTLLARASNDVCRLFRVPCKGQSLEESANQLLDMSRQLLKISAVAPIHFIPRILWMTAVCLRTCRELRQDGGSIDTQVLLRELQC